MHFLEYLARQAFAASAVRLKCIVSVRQDIAAKLGYPSGGSASGQVASQENRIVACPGLKPQPPKDALFDPTTFALGMSANDFQGALNTISQYPKECLEQSFHSFMLNKGVKHCDYHLTPRERMLRRYASIHQSKSQKKGTQMAVKETPALKDIPEFEFEKPHIANVTLSPWASPPDDHCLALGDRDPAQPHDMLVDEVAPGTKTFEALPGLVPENQPPTKDHVPASVGVDTKGDPESVELPKVPVFISDAVAASEAPQQQKNTNWQPSREQDQENAVQGPIGAQDPTAPLKLRKVRTGVTNKFDE